MDCNFFNHCETAQKAKKLHQHEGGDNALYSLVNNQKKTCVPSGEHATLGQPKTANVL